MYNISTQVRAEAGVPRPQPHLRAARPRPGHRAGRPRAAAAAALRAPHPRQVATSGPSLQPPPASDCAGWRPPSRRGTSSCCGGWWPPPPWPRCRPQPMVTPGTGTHHITSHRLDTTLPNFTPSKHLSSACDVSLASISRPQARLARLELTRLHQGNQARLQSASNPAMAAQSHQGQCYNSVTVQSQLDLPVEGPY